MSKYRCPVCGAVHKTYQPQCRLCGQSLAGENVPTSAPAVATATGNSGSVKGVFFIGLAVVLVLLAGAITFGIVQSNRAIEAAKEVVLDQNTDGWSPLVCSVQGSGGGEADTATCSVPQGQGFTVELPGDRTKSNTPFAMAEDQKLQTWSSAVGDDTQIEILFAPVTDPDTGEPFDVKDPDSLQQVADQWMADKGLSRETTSTGASDVQVEETTFRGYPAVKLTTPTTDVQLNGQEAYLQTLLVLRGDVLFAIQTTSIYDDAPQFDRVRQTLTFT